ncbi:hypothetical protein SCOR_18530 [Sulfidibacter corallicola]
MGQITFTDLAVSGDGSWRAIRPAGAIPDLESRRYLLYNGRSLSARGGDCLSGIFEIRTLRTRREAFR